MPEIAARTDIGEEKSTNEDTVRTMSFGDKHLLLVADGMGGHSAGDVASQCAADVVGDIVSDEHSTSDDYELLLESAVCSAHDRIQEQAASNAAQSDMGTTVVASMVTSDEAVIVNVGDSRAYHINDTIEQITVDQSVVRELVNEGMISEEEAQDHPQSNVLSQAVGTTEQIEPDTYRHPVDGTLLLCSDGLCDEVSEQRIHEIVSSSADIESRANQLIKVANELDGSDNISVVLYE